MPKKDKHRPNGDEPGHLFLWHPEATVPRETMQTRGVYPGGYPAGAIIHSTGGAADALEAVREGISNEYAFLCIGRDGLIVQAHPLNEWGYHAGQSYWPSLGKSLSSKLVGISLCGAGKVVPSSKGFYKNERGIVVPASEVRKVGDDYGCEPGFYHAFSLKQEQVLWQLVVWLNANDPLGRFKIENVFGHHEVSGGLMIPKGNIKADPGGSLSLTMEMFRNGLKFYSVEHLAEGFNGYEV